MNHQTGKNLDSQTNFNLVNTLEEIIALAEENYSISELIDSSIYKISQYAQSDKYYFFILDENKIYNAQLNYSNIEEYYLRKIIESNPKMNFERLLKLIFDNRDVVVCDTNGKMLTDINKTDITEYYLGLPLISDQSLFGCLFLKFNKGYGTVFNQIEFIMILINTFFNILQKKLLLKQGKSSSHKFTRMVNDALNGIYQSTEDGHIIYANPAFLSIVGYNSIEELEKIDLFKDMYVSANQRSEFIKQIKNQKKVHNYESLLRDKQGKEINIIENSRLIEQPDGSVVFEGIIQDITQQTSLKNKLKYQITISEQIIENASFLIYGFNQENELVLWNKMAEETTGYTIDELYKDISILERINCGNEFFNTVLELPSFTVNGGDDLSYKEFELHAKFGNKRIVRWSRMRIDSFEDEKYLVLFFGMDITETKKLESQLVESQKMESLGTLAAGIAYDFNKILGELNVYNSSLKSQLKEQDDNLSYVNKIEKTIQRAAASTAKLIGFSRMENRKFVVMDVNEQIDYIIDVLKHTTKENIVIEKELCKKPIIEGDSSQIQQVILNIALNARESISETGKILFRTEIILAKSDENLMSYKSTTDNYVRITIEDTGKGIAKDMHKRIFDPFFTTKSMLKSTGLGLSVAYNVIKNHNGYIFIDSEQNKGSKFYIYFPYTGNETKVIQKDLNEEDITLKNDILILIVDDENIIRDLLHDVLVEQDYKVLLAKNGEEGLDLYKEYQQNIDITILDIIMPGISGKEVFEKIRDINPKAKIIITSGYSKQKITESLIADGANGFLPKPFNIDKLLDLINALMEEN